MSVAGTVACRHLGSWRTVDRCTHQRCPIVPWDGCSEYEEQQHHATPHRRTPSQIVRLDRHARAVMIQLPCRLCFATQHTIKHYIIHSTSLLTGHTTHHNASLRQCALESLPLATPSIRYRLQTRHSNTLHNDYQNDMIIYIRYGKAALWIETFCHFTGALRTLHL